MVAWFLEEKNKRHLDQDHEVLDPQSDVFHMRNLSMREFDIHSKKNEANKAFDEYLLRVREKIKAGKAFYADLNEDV